MRMNLCISAPSGCVLFPLVVLILDLVRSESKLPCYLCLCPRGGNEDKPYDLVLSLKTAKVHHHR
jgi:hypothetical protein